MWNKVGYVIGYSIGLAFFYLLYALGFWGIYSDVSDRKLPLVPLTYIFVLLTWRKFAYLSRQLDDFVKSIHASAQKHSQLTSETQKIYNQLNKFGGPN